MHGRNRRVLVRTLFVVASLGPVACAVLSAVAVRLPGHRTSWERRLGNYMGVIAQCQLVSHPRPGLALLKDVHVLDPQTRRLLVTIRLVEIRAEDHRTQLIFSQPLVRSGCWDRLRELVDGHLHSIDNLADGPIELRCHELTFENSGWRWTVADLVAKATVQQRQQQRYVTITATLRPAARRGTRDIHVARLRWLGDDQRDSELTLDTGENPIPVGFLQDDLTEIVGSQARWQGRLRSIRTQGNRNLVVQGTVDGVDLRVWSRNLAPGPLSGVAKLALTRCSVHNGRIEVVEGMISARDGTMPNEQLEALAARLGCVPRSLPDAPAGGRVRYSQLKAQFTLSADGVSLRGRCDGHDDGVLLADGDRPLLCQPAAERQPVAHLIAAAAADQPLAVPAVDVAAILLGRLPLPGPVATAASYPRVGDVRVRAASDSDLR